jgi:hypothetical protein
MYQEKATKRKKVRGGIEKCICDWAIDGSKLRHWMLKSRKLDIQSLIFGSSMLRYWKNIQQMFRSNLITLCASLFKQY